MWTSPNYFRLLTIIVYFTDEKLQLQTITLDPIELEGEHSESNQAIVVLQVLDDYRIRDKLDYFIIDNISSNDQLIAYIASALNDNEVRYLAEERRLRCNSDIINLLQGTCNGSNNKCWSIIIIHWGLDM